MHDLPDTEDQDAAAERYWPEGYKDVIRTMVGQTFAKKLLEAQAFKSAYETLYNDRFSTYDRFIDRLAEMIVIGAENGADEMFEEIYASFRSDSPLPDSRRYASYLWPGPFSQDLKDEIHQALFDEYSRHHAYEHIHEDHYQGILDFDEFIDQVAELVVAGVEKGADDTLGKIYASFLSAAALPPTRRRPRLLR